MSIDATSIRQLVATHGKLQVEITELDDSSNLFEAGLTSLNTVNLMLAIEDQFDTEFTDDALTRDTFQSVNSLLSVLRSLGALA